MRAAIGCVLVFSIGGGCAEAPGEPGPTSPAPRPGSLSRRVAPGAPADAQGCEVAVRTTVTPAGKRTYLVATELENRSDRVVTLEWLAHCPGPGIGYAGLPARYDYGESCRAGACAGGTEQKRLLTLEPGAARAIGEFTLATRAGPCNGALPVGTHPVWTTAGFSGARLCPVESAEVVVDEPRVRRKHEQKAPKPPSTPLPRRKDCPAMGCRYEPCPPGVEPPSGCAAVCGCAGLSKSPLVAPPRE